MKKIEVDIAVIGGGAAGLTAGIRCAENNCRTLVIERNEKAGGVLLQCIHSGFGVHYFNEELTGPEYAGRLVKKAFRSGLQLLTGTSVLSLEQLQDRHKLILSGKDSGITEVHARAVILAMGCRERCRGNLGVPGERCAGVFNAGLAQQLINSCGGLPGKKAVIAGSGDIGLIMARRLSWNNIKVECVVEIMPYPAGLSRNIAQCLEDFNIPLKLSYAITEIHGHERVEGVSIAPVINGIPDLSQREYIECDTVLFSVGLIPENELAVQCGVELNPLTGGACVDGNLMTSVRGIFACGNVLHVHDLVDFVSAEAERAADSAVKYCSNDIEEVSLIPVRPAENVRYVVPDKVCPLEQNHFFIRSKKIMEHALLHVEDENGMEIFSRKLNFVKPAEMISFEIPGNNAKILEIILKEL